MTSELWPTVAQWIAAGLVAVLIICFTTWLIGRYFLRTQWPRRDAWKENNWVDRRFNDNMKIFGNRINSTSHEPPRGDIDEIDPNWWRDRKLDDVDGEE